MSVTTSESERLVVAGPDIIPLPLKHRRKIIAIPVKPEDSRQAGSGSPQAYREISPAGQPQSGPGQGQQQSKLSPPTPFADITPVNCCFTQAQSGQSGSVRSVRSVRSEIVFTLPAYNLIRDYSLTQYYMCREDWQSSIFLIVSDVGCKTK